MPLYNKTWASDYEELIRYYPRFYREVREMDAILRAHGKLADDMEASIEEVLNDSYIDFADEATIAELEAMLGLSYSSIVGKTLEERRGQVKAYFIGNGKLSASLLTEMIKAYTDAEVDIEFTDYITSSSFVSTYYLDGGTYLNGSRLLNGGGSVTGGVDQALYITITREGTQNISVTDILDLLARVLPAHIIYFISDTLNTILDESELEKIYFRALAIRWNIPEMNNIPYGLTPGLEYDFPEPISEEEQVTVAGVMITGAAIPEEESVSMGTNTAIGWVLDEWLCRYLDGSEMLDGSSLLDSARMDMRPTVTIMPEGFYTEWQGMPVEIETAVNLHYIDGSLKLDGDTLLNSTYEKEDI